MDMKKEARVILLPTDKAQSAIILDNATEMLSWSDMYFTQEDLKYANRKSYHLYIVDDSEIKEGDWYYNSFVKEVWKCGGDIISLSQANELTNGERGCFKVIATTNTQLSTKTEQAGDNAWHQQLPQLQQSFIEEWCKNPVDKVEVEYEEALGASNFPLGVFDLKLTSNNELIIHPIEEKLYTREEMWKCVAQSHIARGGMKNPFDEIPEWFDSWIKENL